MDFQLEDDNFHVKPDGKSFFVTEDEVRNGYYVLEHGTNEEVAALSFNVICRLCQDIQTIHFSRKRKKQLVKALLQYVSSAIKAMASFVSIHSKRTILGWSSSITVQNSANDHVDVASSQTDASASAPKPRRNELAAGMELQGGLAKYTSAKSLSNIQGLWKGLILAILLELNILPSPSNLDELWATNKPTLAKMLWHMVHHQFHVCIVRIYVVNS
jgi:hypothetical protein